MIFRGLIFSWHFSTTKEEVGNWKCTHCGSTDVEAKAWVPLNGEEREASFPDTLDDITDYYCNKCEAHRLVEFDGEEIEHYSGETLCIVTTLEGKSIVSKPAICGPKDSFSKEKGRKESFTKVVQWLGENPVLLGESVEKTGDPAKDGFVSARHFRAEAWKAYFASKIPKPKQPTDEKGADNGVKEGPDPELPIKGGT